MSKQRFLINSIVIISMVLSLLGMSLLAAPQPVQAATSCTDVSLVATADTYLRQSQPTRNYGGSPIVQASPYATSYRQNPLYLWDLISIPTTATVTAVSATFYVTDTSTYDFSLFEMRRTWVEGTSNDATSTTSANWNTYDGSNSWGSGGAMSTTADRYNTDLWDATASTFGSSGSITIPLNSNGVTAVQGWVGNSNTNFGLSVQYTGTTGTNDYWVVSSSEAATVANRPKLNVTYCVETGPTITTSGTLTAFTSQPGVPAPAQTYTVSGRNLTSDISITAPTGFQLSINGISYSSSLTLTQSGGSVPSTTVYARLYSATEGTFSGNIAHASSGATTQNVAVSGTASSCLDVSLTVAEDTYLSANDVTFNNGGNTELHVNGTTGTDRRTTLLKWDVSSIPSNAIASSASISMYVSDASPLVFNLYNMRRTWVEGTGNRTASTTSANWNNYDGANNWGIPGVISTTLDRYDTNLWSAGTTSFSTTGSKAEVLNANGVATVQGWISGTLSNYGLIIQNYSGSTNDAMYFSSSENTTVANRPKLNIHYCVPAAPTINTSGTLTLFSTTPGVPSAEQSYTVSGYNLTDDINVSAPANFELSADLTDAPDGVWSSNLLLYQTSGVVEPTTIYVRLHSETAGTFNGNVIHTSAGATQVNVPVSGSVLPVYTLTVGNDGNGTVTLSPAGSSYSSGTTVTLTPVPNSGYVFSSWGGANDGDIVNTGGVYTIVVNDNKSVTANFVTATCSTVNLVVSEDTYVSAADVQYNNGGNTVIHVDATTGTSRRAALLKWDLSSIPSNAIVSSASILMYVSDASPLVFNLYNMRRTWVEGTVTQTNSTTSANWNTYDGVNSWGTVGISNTTSDRYDTNLWSAGTTSFSSTGSKTQALNANGVAVVQGWINGSTSNYGLTMQNYYGSTSDAVYFSSSENTTAANRPRLNVTYCTATTGPTINTTSSLSAFSSNVGVPSAEQSYTVAGSNLTNDIVITAPADFQISKTSGSGFGSTITLTQTGGTVPSTTIYVRFLRATTGTSNGNITHVSTGATQVNVPISGTANNGAPTIALVQPANGTTGVSTSPTLEVRVTDPDADASSVSFYGRPVGTGSGEDFTVVLIPDAQNESQYAPAMFISQTNWIVANKVSRNIVFVTTLGDMVNTSSDTTQYVNADAAIDVLDPAGVRYSVAPGNHDTAYGTTYYANYFGISRYAERQVSDGYWFGDSPAPYDDYNTYSLFSAGGMEFILINLQYSPSTAAINWADALLTTYSNRRAIVEQHDILNVNTTWNNQASYNALRDHDNLFLMVSGHMHSGSDGAAYVAGTGTDGHTIHVVQADYQDMSNGNGYLRILRFSPANNMIYMNTYSPYANAYITSTTNYDTADLAYSMASSEPYTLIGTVSGIASGSNASISWLGRATNQAYEWYAVANDGTTSTTGATWTFTTTDTAVEYTLTTNIVGTGTVAKNPNAGTYTLGSVVTLTATPGIGYVFSGWSGALSGSANPTTITMDANKVITATFLAQATRAIYAGWNLIAMPLQPQPSFTAQGLLNSLNAQGGACIEVDDWYYGEWISYAPGLEDFSLLPGHGYFVSCANSITWYLPGYAFTSGVPISLIQGWNLLSVPYPAGTYTSQSLLNAINTQGGTCNEVDSWYYGEWASYTPGLDPFVINPDEGYFVQCNSSSIFTP